MTPYFDSYCYHHRVISVQTQNRACCFARFLEQRLHFSAMLMVQMTFLGKPATEWRS